MKSTLAAIGVYLGSCSCSAGTHVFTRFYFGNKFCQQIHRKYLNLQTQIIEKCYLLNFILCYQIDTCVTTNLMSHSIKYLCLHIVWHGILTHYMDHNLLTNLDLKYYRCT